MVGVHAATARLEGAIADTVPARVRDFVSLFDSVALCAASSDGRLWTSLWLGNPGFLESSADGDVVTVRRGPSRASADDPVSTSCVPGGNIGMLAIDFATRRRLRINGTIAAVDERALVVAVRESFVNHGPRDAWQVAANGGLFALSALAMRIQPDSRWIALGAGSLAASAADTWATELGMLYGGAPRSIVTWRVVPVGTSGGVSAIGTLAALAASGFVAGLVLVFGWIPRIGVAVAIGGVAGALADSLLGGTLQSRRWCDACNRRTERTVHDCGSVTRHEGGVSWVDNDMVNFLSGAIGGLVSAFLAG